VPRDTSALRAWVLRWARQKARPFDAGELYADCLEINGTAHASAVLSALATRRDLIRLPGQRYAHAAALGARALASHRFMQGRSMLPRTLLQGGRRGDTE